VKLFSRDGDGSAAEDAERNRDHAIMLQENGQSNPDVDPDFVQRMTETDLSDGTAQQLSNLMSRDWLLSMLTDAEVHEARWLARTMIDELEAMHPPADSIWQGKYRQYAFNDKKEMLEPLNESQKLEIFEFVQAFITRVARSREGFQQEIFKKQIKKSEREDLDRDDDGGGWT